MDAGQAGPGQGRRVLVARAGRNVVGQGGLVGQRARVAGVEYRPDRQQIVTDGGERCRCDVARRGGQPALIVQAGWERVGPDRLEARRPVRVGRVGDDDGEGELVAGVAGRLVYALEHAHDRLDDVDARGRGDHGRGRADPVESGTVGQLVAADVVVVGARDVQNDRAVVDLERLGLGVVPVRVGDVAQGEDDVLAVVGLGGVGVRVAGIGKAAGQARGHHGRHDAVGQRANRVAADQGHAGRQTVGDGGAGELAFRDRHRQAVRDNLAHGIALRAGHARAGHRLGKRCRGHGHVGRCGVDVDVERSARIAGVAGALIWIAARQARPGDVLTVMEDLVRHRVVTDGDRVLDGCAVSRGQVIPTGRQVAIGDGQTRRDIARVHHEAVRYIGHPGGDLVRPGGAVCVRVIRAAVCDRHGVSDRVPGVARSGARGLGHGEPRLRDSDAIRADRAQVAARPRQGGAVDHRAAAMVDLGVHNHGRVVDLERLSDAVVTVGVVYVAQVEGQAVAVGDDQVRAVTGIVEATREAGGHVGGRVLIDLRGDDRIAADEGHAHRELIRHRCAWDLALGNREGHAVADLLADRHRRQSRGGEARAGDLLRSRRQHGVHGGVVGQGRTEVAAGAGAVGVVDEAGRVCDRGVRGHRVRNLKRIGHDGDVRAGGIGSAAGHAATDCARVARVGELDPRAEQTTVEIRRVDGVAGAVGGAQVETARRNHEARVRAIGDMDHERVRVAGVLNDDREADVVARIDAVQVAVD